MARRKEMWFLLSVGGLVICAGLTALVVQPCVYGGILCYHYGMARVRNEHLVVMDVAGARVNVSNGDVITVNRQLVGLIAAVVWASLSAALYGAGLCCLRWWSPDSYRHLIESLGKSQR